MSTVSKADTLRAIEKAMLGGGFTSLRSPLVVAGVPFDVVAAYAGGSGSLDLVVVVDATDGTSSQLQRGYWLIERVARALDQVESRRPLTAVIVHDDTAARVPTEDFLRLARVLLVTGADHVERELAPILPLVFDVSSKVSHDPMEEILRRNLAGADGLQRSALIAAAQRGADEVETAFIGWLDQSFDGGEE